MNDLCYWSGEVDRIIENEGTSAIDLLMQLYFAEARERSNQDEFVSALIAKAVLESARRRHEQARCGD